MTIVVLVTCGFILLVRAQAQAVEGSRPNILFMISDDHRWDALGAAGNSKVHTPNLDRLAREGVYFRQGTVSTPQCTPARAALLTGVYGHTSGWYSNDYRERRLDRREGFDRPMLPVLLGDAGYRTVLVGKWHLPMDPWNCGFDDVRLWMTSGGGPYKGAELSYGKSREQKTNDSFTNVVFADSAIEFLAAKEAKDQPFFLWCAFTAPHKPLEPNPPHIRKLYEGKTTQDLLPPGFPEDIPTGDFLHYYEAVSTLDEQVGRLLGALEESGLADNTVVVFLGDNGFMMGVHGVGAQGGAGKVVPYEGSIRVPFIARMPGGTSGTSDAAVNSIDLPVTFIKLAGAEPPSDWPGRDMTPLLAGACNEDAAAAFADAYVEYPDNKSKKFGHLAYRLVRTPTHKLVDWQDPQRQDALFDLIGDPLEQANRIDDPALAATSGDLRQRLRKWMDRTSDPAANWPQ